MTPVLLVILLATLSGATTTHYHIVPINYTHRCHDYTNETCFTLDQLSLLDWIQLSGDIIVSFLPGEHLLTRRMRFGDGKVHRDSDITLNIEHNHSNRSTNITCFGYNAGFEFQFMNTVTIEGLDISGCIKGSYGGAVNVVRVTNVYIRDCDFTGNQVTGEYGSGGAVYVGGGMNVSIRDCQFIDNQATIYGGAVYVLVDQGTNVSIRDCQFTGNQAAGEYGHGGAIYVIRSSFQSSGNVYTNNTCGSRGGAVYVFDLSTDSVFTNDTFTSNVALYGAAIYSDSGTIEIGDSTFTDNRHTLGGNGVVYLRQSTLKICGIVSFLDNHGSLYAFNSRVEFHGTTTFTNNTGESGGAITSITSTITFQTTSKTIISENTASHGGGLFLEGSTMNTFGDIMIIENKATTSGGGIYAFQSNFEFRGESQKQIQHTNITNNLALSDGGGVYLTASTLKLSYSFLIINDNRANRNGGGIFLEQTSKIDLNKQYWEYFRFGDYNVKLEFTNNSALYGGAVYMSDSSNAGVLCEENKLSTQRGLSSQQCFLQTFKLYSFPYVSDYNAVNTFFTDNSAVQTGSDIYGGLLDRCTINPLAEVHRDKGIEYFNATASFNWTNGHIQDISNFSNRISSDAVRVCFCLDNIVTCDYTHPTMFVKKGEMFTLSVVAVDQVRNPVHATVVSSLLSDGEGIGRLKEGQMDHSIQNQCTELQYNVYSTADTTKIQLYADGPCGNQGISKQEINITFLQCDCPVGFQKSPSPIDCACDCDTRLTQYVNNCSSENETIQVINNVWIKYDNSSNESGFVIYDCPFDYCVARPVNISLNSPSEADKQCAFDRTGDLCGECEQGLSLMFASSRCKQCSNYFIFLLLLFSLAGIALVVLILILNMTVASGTMNGLIFYANILAANRPIFLPFNNPLTIFISWLNLDLGIETCFYDGMDSYAKVLLQLVFPSYQIFLIAIIIVVCEYSQRVSTLLGKRNPVATLCTLILLSYSKLLRTIIASLQFTTLNYPDGSHEIVWLYDANVPYFTPSHIPRFLAALFIIIIGAVYTILLLFGQAFYCCSHHKMMKWISHPKYDSFIKEYHAPLSPKHRYWVGLLLLARIIHYLISAFTSDPIVILSAGIIASGLVLLKLLNKKTYKNWVIDNLETSFLFNLLILSIATFFVKLEDEDQQALANTSMAVSFLTFLGIVTYHSLEKCWDKGSLKFYQTAKDSLKKRPKDLPAVENNDNLEDLSDIEEIELPQYTADNGDARSTYHTQPIIRRAVPDDQLREPALDDLLPVRPEDYIVSPSPRPRHKQETTFTVVDIRDDQEEEN